MSSSFIHVVECVGISFLFKAEPYSSVGIYHILLTRSPLSGHLGCSHLLALVSNATINMGVYKYLPVSLLSLLLVGNSPLNY